MREIVAILGAGAWGTALSVHLARSPRLPQLRLWSRSAAHVREMASTRENARYLPGVPLSPKIDIVTELEECVSDATLIVVATPIGALLEVAARLQASSGIPLVWLGKGFVASRDPPGVGLAHRELEREWRGAVGAVSGPSFAEEVARGLPTAVSVAASDTALAERLAGLLRGETLRAYVSDDLTGVEVGGAVKNVLAIAAGASDGLGFGNNARAALITRGLAETGRLSAALGGKRETLMGLSGLGDLVLTCTGDLSRNRRVGLELAKSRPLDAILGGLGHVAEGVSAARATELLASSLGIDMPICAAVYRVLYERLPPKRAVEGLLAREPGPEFQ
jgi:glycerol-3-phosphate dehydrogenase (NAD(P)+)